MRADRLLAILLLLQAHGRMSARTIAGRLEISERTVYRDMDALSAAGVPVYTERGRQGGCALLPGYRADVSGLTATEARALFVFAGGGTLKDLGLDQELKAALRKLMASLPEAQRSGAMRAQERIVVEPRGWMRPAGTASLTFEAVQEAVWGERRLQIRYRSSGAPAAHLVTLDPYGLVAKAGIWYLIAAEGGEPRLYRVSRIESVESLDEPARRPVGLDLEDLWRQLRRRVEERGTGLAVRLRVRVEQSDRLPPGSAARNWSGRSNATRQSMAAAGRACRCHSSPRVRPGVPCSASARTSRSLRHPACDSISPRRRRRSSGSTTDRSVRWFSAGSGRRIPPGEEAGAQLQRDPAGRDGGDSSEDQHDEEQEERQLAEGILALLDEA